MSSPQLFFAQLPLETSTSKVPTFLVSDMFLVVAAALVIGGAIVAWLVVFRGPKSDISPARRVYKGHAPAEEESEEPETSSSGRRRKKRRSRRREHRSRNPTLAETGGLPPPRGPEAPLIP